MEQKGHFRYKRHDCGKGHKTVQSGKEAGTGRGKKGVYRVEGGGGEYTETKQMQELGDCERALRG